MHGKMQNIFYKERSLILNTNKLLSSINKSIQLVNTEAEREPTSRSLLNYILKLFRDQKYKFRF